MGPGSYLLSRDLSSDYHRRADVSLPGSEWIRVGPSGYDHQASKGGMLCSSSVCLVLFVCCCLLAGCFGGQIDIRVAGGVGFVFFPSGFRILLS